MKEPIDEYIEKNKPSRLKKLCKTCNEWEAGYCSEIGVETAPNDGESCPMWQKKVKTTR
jgi:hypothetical protein